MTHLYAPNVVESTMIYTTNAFTLSTVAQHNGGTQNFASLTPYLGSQFAYQATDNFGHSEVGIGTWGAAGAFIRAPISGAAASFMGLVTILNIQMANNSAVYRWDYLP